MVRTTALTLMLMAACLTGCGAKDGGSAFNREALMDPTGPEVNKGSR